MKTLTKDILKIDMYPISNRKSFAHFIKLYTKKKVKITVSFHAKKKKCLRKLRLTSTKVKSLRVHNYSTRKRPKILLLDVALSPAYSQFPIICSPLW